MKMKIIIEYFLFFYFSRIEVKAIKIYKLTFIRFPISFGKRLRKHTAIIKNMKKFKIDQYVPNEWPKLKKFAWFYKGKFDLAG